MVCVYGSDYGSECLPVDRVVYLGESVSEFGGFAVGLL